MRANKARNVVRCLDFLGLTKVRKEEDGMGFGLVDNGNSGEVESEARREGRLLLGCGMGAEWVW